MKLWSKRWSVVASLAVVLGNPLICVAQETGAFAVEGYVFDKKTTTPLAGVSVSIVVVAPAGETTAPAYVGRTDDNGFYSISAKTAYEPTGNLMTAACPTKKGTATGYSALYEKIQTDRIYQRNFYLTLPKNATKCQ